MLHFLNLRPQTKMKLMEWARPVVRTAKPAVQLPAKPLSSHWGFDRGTPVARYFIDRFMEANRSDITGVALEIKSPLYIDQLGSGIEHTDILDIDSANTCANIIADLATADNVASDRYDCVLVNETLQFVYDLHGAVGHLHRMLKPGGALLVTVPCTAQRDRELAGVEYWRFTDVLCERLFAERFGAGNVHVETYGNYNTCVAGLTGLAIDEIDPAHVDRASDIYLQGICVRAVKAARATASDSPGR